MTANSPFPCPKRRGLPTYARFSRFSATPKAQKPARKSGQISRYAFPARASVGLTQGLDGWPPKNRVSANMSAKTSGHFARLCNPKSASKSEVI